MVVVAVLPFGAGELDLVVARPWCRSGSVTAADDEAVLGGHLTSPNAFDLATASFRFSWQLPRMPTR